MKKGLFLLQVCLFVIVVGLLSFAGKKNHRAIAFEASYTTTSERIDGPPLVKLKITGLGTSSELNITKFVAISTQDRRTAPPFKISGTCSWYAKDGDSFTSSFAGTATPGADSTLVVVMTNTITGGTGKFLPGKRNY